MQTDYMNTTGNRTSYSKHDSPTTLCGYSCRVLLSEIGRVAGVDIMRLARLSSSMLLHGPHGPPGVKESPAIRPQTPNVIKSKALVKDRI